ncbi:hypothetical protein [Flavobacterium sp. LM4]|uniref:hypothetical protein n=1 Tax=Flavobacterium sp. LM4 TaxID=1938609 RepID=UPI0009D58BD7|nr:hypothetical protein [Flavobacterium sp. LM4]OOV19045.1 hypothetical protein BXU10_05065 [Flavobacterium sp. LM4]
MKKKFIIINVFLSMAVLFSILFQSIHSHEHHTEKLAEKHCHYSKSKAEVAHSHSISEKCFTCDFNFILFTITNFYVLHFHKNSAVNTLTSFFFYQHSSFFKGSLFSLRGPPIFQII